MERARAHGCQIFAGIASVATIALLSVILAYTIRNDPIDMNASLADLKTAITEAKAVAEEAKTITEALQSLTSRHTEAQENSTITDTLMLSKLASIDTRLDTDTTVQSQQTSLLTTQSSALGSISANLSEQTAYAAADQTLQQQQNTLLTNLVATQQAASSEINATIVSPRTAFGELTVASLRPEVQASFASGAVRASVFETFSAGTGAITVDDGLMKCDSGAGLYSYAVVRTRHRVHYRPGFGALARFTSRFDGAIANGFQIAGVGNSGNGFFFGYHGDKFGVMHRTHGRHEYWELEVTTAAGASDTTVTLLLGGTNHTFTLTNAGGDTSFSAWQLMSNGATGWDVYSSGNKARFFYTSVGNLPDTFAVYKLPAGQFAATWTKLFDGRANTERWTYQGDWNRDSVNGTGSSKFALDPSKGNVYSIQYQWLGFGAITFMVENPRDGRFMPVHQIEYANSNTELSVEIPSMQMMWVAASLGSTSPLQTYGASVGLFVEGQIRTSGPYQSTSSVKTIGQNTQTNIVCLRVRDWFNKAVTFSAAYLLHASVAAEGTKPVKVRLVLTPTSIGAGTTGDYPDWTDVDTSDSYVEYDVNSATLTGGTVVYSASLAKSDSTRLDLRSINMDLQRSERLCLTAETTGTNSEISASVVWSEKL